MTLADIAAKCQSLAFATLDTAAELDARSRDGDVHYQGAQKLANEALDRAEIVYALATLLDRLARVPMANSYPPYVDAAQRLADLAGVDL